MLIFSKKIFISLFFSIIIFCFFSTIIYYINTIFQNSNISSDDLNFLSISSLENLLDSSNLLQNNSNIEPILNFFFQNTNSTENSDKLFWPTPGYHTITSPFGYRISPITGNISNHSGIDIGAQEGTYIYSVSIGIVTLANFNGANGYSIHIEQNNFTYIYGHVSPNYIVSVGDIIETGQIIGNVGPKYVTSTHDNTYKDNSGKSTNGSTTGPHLHLTIKKDGNAVNPIDYF